MASTHYISRGSYPASLSASAIFKVGVVCSGSFRLPGLFLAQQPSKLALFVPALSFLLVFFFSSAALKVGLVCYGFFRVPCVFF